MRHIRKTARLLLHLVFALALYTGLLPVQAEGTNLQTAFNQRYRNYFGSDSQALLPFPVIGKPAWGAFQQSRKLEEVYREEDKYYNSKVYTFTLYKDMEDGCYYLNAKGGFWGMDELIYGPLKVEDLR